MAHEYDGFFKMDERGDGFYLTVTPPQAGGKAVEYQAIVAYLAQKGVEKYNSQLIHDTISRPEDNIIVKVADKYIDNQVAGDKSYKVEVSEDRMHAYMTFYPVNGEEQYTVPKDELERALASRNVKYGINEELLELISTERVFGDTYEVAVGTFAVDPVPGSVELKFKTTKDFAPEIDEQGNVNYRKLSVINNVKEGDLLAVLHQTVPGQPGTNLSGVELAPMKAKPVRIRYGKNTKPNGDKTELYADKSGLVKLFDGKIVVNNVYEVPNHVGPSTGDVEFDGSVIVHGNVVSGYTVRAKGDVEVMGVVEGAAVYAGGDIVLHSGIQGMGKSHVEAGGNLQTKFIEQANVTCGGDIHSEAILHSEVSCKGEITVEGKKGMISGGAVRSGIAVNSKTLGSHMGTATEIEVGIDPKVLEEYNSLRKDLPKIIEEADKLEKVILLLNKRKEMEGELDAEKAEMYKSAVRNKVFLANKISVSQKRVEELQTEVDNRNSGFVRVQGVVYPGVKVGIGNIYHFIKDEIKYVRLYRDGADIKMSAL